MKSQVGWWFYYHRSLAICPVSRKVQIVVEILALHRSKLIIGATGTVWLIYDWHFKTYLWGSQ